MESARPCHKLYHWTWKVYFTQEFLIGMDPLFAFFQSRWALEGCTSFSFYNLLGGSERPLIQAHGLKDQVPPFLLTLTPPGHWATFKLQATVSQIFKTILLFILSLSSAMWRFWPHLMPGSGIRFFGRLFELQPIVFCCLCWTFWQLLAVLPNFHLGRFWISWRLRLSVSFREWESTVIGNFVLVVHWGTLVPPLLPSCVLCL